MISLLRSAGNDGSVSASELADFRMIVSNATQYRIPNYVQGLASNVVNTNPANLLYQGRRPVTWLRGALRSVEQTRRQMVPWTDLPTLTSSSFTYRQATGPLFVGTPTRNDMRQGQLGDCYFIATLGALADRNPNAVKNMFVDNNDGTFTIRFLVATTGCTTTRMAASAMVSGPAPQAWPTM